MMMGLLVMLAQQILAVVVAIRSANDHVDVVSVRLLVLGERLTSLVVKLNDQHRAMDTVVKHAVFFRAAHPGKVGVAEMPFHLFYLCFGVTRSDTADVNLNQAEQKVMLRG